MEYQIKEILLKTKRKSGYKNDFNEIINGFDLKYRRIKKHKSSISDFLKQNEKFKGLYVFFIENEAIYVGIAKNIRHRIMQHVNGSHHSTSTFAYKIAKMILKEEKGITYSGTKKDYFEKNLDSIKNIKETLKKLNVSTIKIEDDDELALFEIYCSMKFETTLNTFETH